MDDDRTPPTAPPNIRSIGYERLYASVFATCPDAILLLDEGGFFDCNRTALAMFACTSKDMLLSLHPADVSPPYQIDGQESYPAAMDKVTRALSGEDLRFEWIHKRFDGTTFSAEVLLSPLDHQGRTILQAVVRDISERKEMEAVRAELEEQLVESQRLEAIGRLAGGVAHDFNNLLTGILGYTDLLLADRDEDAPDYEDLQQIAAAAKRAASLTQQLLAFGRKQIREPRTVNINDAVRTTLEMLQRVIGDGIVVRLQLSDAPILIEADPSQLDQILMNLSVNARDAMGGSGVLTISTRVVHLPSSPTDTIELTPGRYLVLEVSDTAQGIDEPHLPHIFEPFYTTKRAGRGTGLGLSTVYGIVKQNGGSIDVTTCLGKGTRFTIHLPVAEATVLFEEAPLQEPPTPEPERLLLVEDEDMLRRLAERLLGRQGYRVLSATTGEEALRMMEAADGPIDLLVTDMAMPTMNGTELYEQCRKRQPDLDVLFMSGYPKEELQDQGMEEEDVHFIQKPFAIGEFVDLVRGILDGTVSE